MARIRWTTLSGRFGLCGGACALAVLALAILQPASASALGKVINVGTPYESGPPAVAVESTGDALVAWANTKDLAGASNFVQYCVVPAGAVGCSHTGNLFPADGAVAIDGVQVLALGGTLVILADVFGAQGNQSGDYQPEQEWQSTDGGATWAQPAAGLSVSDGVVNADTGPLSAVIVPGTGVLGYGWETAAGAPTFNAFPLSSPPECSTAICNGLKISYPEGPFPYATLEPETNPDTVGNGGGAYASEAGAAPGVMTVFNTLFTNGPLGCSQDFGTAYAYGSGNQSATNNYNISPGLPNSAWRFPLSQLDCNVERPAVGGGPSGFGVIELNEGTHSVIYHRFDPATMKFDTAPVTVYGGQAELFPSVEQDGEGGIYSTYLLGGAGGKVELSYSADGGHSFTSGSINPDSDVGINDLNSAVNGAGQGWATWIDNGSVFVQPFQAKDAINAADVAATPTSSGTSTGTTVTVTITCPTACTVTITIEIVEGSGARAGEKSKKPKLVKFATGKFSLKAAGKDKLKLKLTSLGRTLFKSDHNRVRTTMLLTTKNVYGTFHTTHTVKISKGK